MQVCGLKAGDFVHVIGDAHVYLNHRDALKQQLVRWPGGLLRSNKTKKRAVSQLAHLVRSCQTRAPRPFPMLTIKDRKGAGPVTVRPRTSRPSTFPRHPFVSLPCFLSLVFAAQDIDGFEYSDFEITGYRPHGALKMKMAV